MKFENYLKEVFGKELYIENMSDNYFAPIFLHEQYEFFKSKIQETYVHFVVVKEKTPQIQSLHKHLELLNSYGIDKPILVFDSLRKEKRNRLIQERIPFICDNRQMYIPYLCMDINEYNNNVVVNKSTFSVWAQVLFIYFALNKIKVVDVSELIDKFSFSSMTASRALRELCDFGLLIDDGNRTRKKYRLIDMKNYWANGSKALMSPVKSKLYFENKPKNIKTLFSGETALSRQSMLIDANMVTLATVFKNRNEIEKDSKLLEDIEDLNQHVYCVEFWKYDPCILSKDKVHVDIISLYSAMQSHNDSRIDIEFKKLLEEELYGKDGYIY